MSDNQANFAEFGNTINESERVWALQNSDGDWVVCDSSEFENADVMPVWAKEEDAQKFCVDEWQDYQVASIPLDDFLEEWIGDLNEDGVLLGINWQLDEEGIELDAIKAAKLLINA